MVVSSEVDILDFGLFTFVDFEVYSDGVAYDSIFLHLRSNRYV